ncbi:paired box protein Pax-6-like isoform X2 [Corticium candelabrum]|nr:paired box protein Pax-6-like isoform X2 [Corticium candelabrum]
MGVDQVRMPKVSSRRRKGRTRLMFTRAQSRELERIYDNNKYPKLRTRLALAAQMNIAERRVQIWFQNRRAKTKREDKLMNPESSKQIVCASPPDHDSTSCEGETPEGNDCEEDKDSNKNRSPLAQHVPQPSLPPSFPEFDPGYPDVGSELVIDQPPTPLHATSLPVFPSAPTNTSIPTSLIPCFPTPISQPSPPKTTLNYSYTPLWSHDTVINAKELEELLVTLLSSHMPKTLHATDGQRLESFKGFVNSQCNLLHQKDAEYQAMLCAI